MKHSTVKHKKLRLTIVAVLMCALLLPTTASAAGPVFGYHMTGGISNIYMYIDSSGSPTASYWQNLIKSAVDNWMYTGVGANDFYCQGYVSSGTSGSKMDWYGRNSSYWGNDGDNVLAETKFYTYEINQVYPWNADWYSAEFNLNDPLLRQDKYSNDDAIFVFIHEMGHGFGLAHNNDPNSVMYPALDGCNVRRVQKVDNDTLNTLY